MGMFQYPAMAIYFKKSPEAVEIVFIIIQSVWNLTGVSAARLPGASKISMRCDDLKLPTAGSILHKILPNIGII